MGKAVAGLSWKGGTGKSTLLASLAYALRRETPLRIAALDLTEDQLLSDYLAPGCKARGVIEFVYGGDVEVCSQSDGALVDTIPFGTPATLPQEATDLILEVIRHLKARYDLVFIDLPGVGEAYNFMLLPILREVEIPVIVTTPAFIRQARMAREAIPDSRPVVVILNMYVEGAPKHEAEPLAVTKHGRYFFVVPFDSAAWRAGIEKKLAVLYKTSFWKHVDEIAAAIFRLVAATS